MTPSPIRSGFASQRGQSMPLGAVSLAICALMVFLTLNIGRAVHEKIRLQNATDARAFSYAVQEARTFNYIAYTNRAIANTYVAMASLHAYMTEAAMMADADFGMFEAMLEIAAQEFAECLCYWGIPCKIQHCIHSVEALINAGVYVAKWVGGDVGSWIRELDSPFMNSMKALNLHLQVLSDTQTVLVDATYLNFLTTVDREKGKPNTVMGASVMSAPVKEMGPAGAGIAAMNALQFRTATTSQLGTRVVEMTSVANATRPFFTWDRGGEIGPPVIPNVILQPILSQVKKQAAVSGFNAYTIHQLPNIVYESGGRTAFVQGGFPGFESLTPDAPANAQGNAIDSFDYAIGFVSWKDGAAIIPNFPLLGPIGPGELITSAQAKGMTSREQQGQQQGMNQANQSINNARNDVRGNSHMSSSDKNNALNALNQAQNQLNSGGSSANPKHRVDLGINIDNPHSGSEHNTPKFDFGSFTDFNISDQGKDRFNQPVVYAGLESDLRVNEWGQRGPWELKQSGGLKINTGGASGTLVLGDDPARQGKGQAVAKAMVYYHRFGDWSEYPNFFNPYWRAKMDSFDSMTELTEVLAAGLATTYGPATDAAAAIDPGAVNLKRR